ncbi:MAG TPA: type II toxin-antitoxin system VapC family toxin [Thermoplasmata archaeon]|nr:type II toxin-antitoxin system VapC family toxin [Thermoplasmata archaeon]
MTGSEDKADPAVCIDSYGWIEHFTGGPKAAAYGKVMASVDESRLLTPVVVLYEVYRKIKATVNEEVAVRHVAALDRTRVVPVDREISLEAADYSLSHKLHFSDALIYATARRFGAELYTSDPALKGLRSVSYV